MDLGLLSRWPRSMSLTGICLLVIMVLGACEASDRAESPPDVTNPNIASDSKPSGNSSRDSSNQPRQSGNTSSAAATYTIVESEEIVPPNQRVRGVVRIQMDPNQPDEAQAQGMVNAIREARGMFPTATIHIVFAYSTQDVGGYADIGRAYVSRDGRGMAGDGSGLITGDEEGVIRVQTDEQTYFFDE